jgi:methionine-R-sulfoxide reductase
MENFKKTLTEIQYKVTQENWTEPPFDNEYYNNEEEWIYVDVVDWTVLFSSNDKFDSGCGWPSFSKWIDKENLYEDFDESNWMRRTEVRGSKSDSHLWHVFTDWPKEMWGLRYCINSAALKFIWIEELKWSKYEKYLELFNI